MNTSQSRVLDCRNAALISTEANIKLSFSATAINSLKDSLAAMGLSDWGFKDSWKPLANNQALQVCFGHHVVLFG